MSRVSATTPTVEAIGRLNITGNVIPANWWHNIKLPSGQPDSTAIVLLSEIIYWYRPSEIRDELSGALIGYRRRFRGDKLQRDYQSFAEQFGFSKRAATDAIKRLRDAGLITTELRTIKNAEGRSMPNVLFVEPVPEAIENITNGTYPPIQRNIPHAEAEDTQQSGGTYPALRRNTNTEITTENTTEITTENYCDTALPIARQKTRTRKKSAGFDPLTAKPENVSPQVWADWVAHRREIRKPLTETSCRLQAKKLAGHPDPDAVIMQSIACGWTGLFADRPISGRGGSEHDCNDISSFTNVIPRGFVG